MWQSVLHPANAAGTLTAPITGVLVSFTIRKLAAPGPWAPVHVRVIHPLAPSLWRPDAASAEVVPSPAGGLETFPVRLPVAAGDYLGIEYSAASGAANVYMFESSPYFAQLSVRAPAWSTGDPAESHGGAAAWEILLRGRVEPDADADGFGDETQDGCPRLAETKGACPRKKCKRKRGTKKKKKTAAAAKKPKRKRCAKRNRKKPRSAGATVGA